MISPGDLVVVIVAVSIVAAFFFATRHFLRRAEQTVACEDGSGTPGASHGGPTHRSHH